MSRPNILYLMTDQHLARALGCMGHAVVRTPHLDQLAAGGTLFERAYCPSPICGPSRAALFCGLFPSASGRVANHDTFRRPVTILPEALRDAGYHTAMAGKLHLAPIERDWGFETKHLHDAPYDCYDPREPAQSEYVHWLARRRGCGIAELVARFNADEDCLDTDPYRFLMGSNWRSAEEHSNTWVTDRAIDCLQEAPADRPFFLFASWFGPHQPMAAPEPWANMYAPDDIPMPPEYFAATDNKPLAAAHCAHSPLIANLSPSQYREVLAAYDGQVSMIDHEVGRLLAALVASGRADNTIVVFTADHGDHAAQFGLFFKCTMYENSVRVPLIVRDPRRPAGKRCRQLVSNLDTYATVLEAAGIPVPTPTHSRSLAPLLEAPDDDAWPDLAYAEIGALRMLAHGDWKLIRKDDVEELYHLAENIPDLTNCRGAADFRDILNALRAHLDDAPAACAR